MAYEGSASREICSRRDVLNTPPRWTAERTELLRRLWKEGLSASQCAKQIGGITRNAVIGKVHRLGLAKRGAESQDGKVKRAAATRRRVQTLPALPAPRKAFVEPIPVLPPIGATKIEHMEPGTCLHITGDVRTSYRLCGRAAEGSYCREHRALVYRTETDKRAPGSRPDATARNKQSFGRFVAFNFGFAS